MSDMQKPENPHRGWPCLTEQQDRALDRCEAWDQGFASGFASRQPEIDRLMTAGQELADAAEAYIAVLKAYGSSRKRKRAARKEYIGAFAALGAVSGSSEPR